MTPTKTPHQLRQLAAWIDSHGLPKPALLVDGAVAFTCHDGKRHAVTTLRAARAALGY